MLLVILITDQRRHYDQQETDSLLIDYRDFIYIRSYFLFLVNRSRHRSQDFRLQVNGYLVPGDDTVIVFLIVISVMFIVLSFQSIRLVTTDAVLTRS